MLQIVPWAIFGGLVEALEYEEVSELFSGKGKLWSYYSYLQVQYSSQIEAKQAFIFPF